MQMLPRRALLFFAGMSPKPLMTNEPLVAKATKGVGHVFALVTAACIAASIAGIMLLAEYSWAQTTPPPVDKNSFIQSTLGGTSSTNPTSLQFGPDDRLYVAERQGIIKAYTLTRNASNSYTVDGRKTETISSIKSIPNHNDNGKLNTNQTKRHVTGIVVAGTRTNPVIYVSSSDPRVGGGESGNVTNLDTNSGIISRLRWDSSSSKWVKNDLVRGLPRSEADHASNGMQLSDGGKTLYLAQGGSTNQGAPSFKLAYLPEYALSSAILKIDLNAPAIGCTPDTATCTNKPYDLTTLDDEDRSGNPDRYDPFGGNNGKNQAVLDSNRSNGPVQVYASGFRNPYDLLITKGNNQMYTVDNGGNATWGDKPDSAGTGRCTNKPMDGGFDNRPPLHLINAAGYYGHPNPTRADMANTFNSTKPQSPVATADPIECSYQKPLKPDFSGPALTVFPAPSSPDALSSTNGLTEYTASNLGGAMKGNLLAADWYQKLYRIQLNSSGDQVVSNEVLLSGLGTNPLDVTTQGDSVDGAKFPGTIWVADYSSNNIIVLEPKP